MLDSVVGGVPHEVAIVGFDSSPVLVRDFTSDTAAAGRAIQALVAGNSTQGGAAILDSLAFSIDLLRTQPPQYRRAILLISETVDAGSNLKLDEVLRAISDSNTTIYAVAFSSGKDYMKREGPKTFGKGSIPLLSSKTGAPPGPAHGCMSRDPNDPQVDLDKNPARQAYDCLSLLAPPLRLAKKRQSRLRMAYRRTSLRLSPASPVASISSSQMKRASSAVCKSSPTIFRTDTC
jgi:hypothetical protein